MSEVNKLINKNTQNVAFELSSRLELLHIRDNNVKYDCAKLGFLVVILLPKCGIQGPESTEAMSTTHEKEKEKVSNELMKTSITGSKVSLKC